MSTIVNKIEEILKSEYSVQNYVELMTEILDGLQIVAPNKQNRIYSNFSSHILGFSHIGNYTSPDKKKIIVMAVELKQLAYVENSRSTQRSFAKQLIENSNADAALIAFYTEGVGMWRLSFVRLDYEMKIENGKLKTAENMTPARRYSFLVGKDEPCHTAIDRFRMFIESRSTYPTLDDLENAFSVEAVTKEFFDLYCDKFIQLRNHLENNEDFVAEATLHNYSSAQFAKKLMGQIVFLYFLQKKGWLGVKAWPRQMSATEYKKAFYARGARSRELIPQLYLQMDDNTYRLSAAALQSLSDEDETFLSTCVRGEAWGTGPHNFMRKLFEEATKKGANFFDDYLEPLFYDALNVNRGEQGYDPALHCRIPFLSGGLFEPIDGYDWKHNNFGIPNEIFSNRDGDKDRLADGILDIFDRYNFTMSEDEPMEREVAIDPEMLGKVFENLLDITDRKSKGAFYTPREIVHYMCQESLINYLTNAMKVKEMSIRDFILYGDMMTGEDASVLNRAAKGDSYDLWISEELYLLDKNGNIVVDRMAELDKALQDVRIADPAVGSGAFPLGMLNEIVRARQNITTYMGLTLKIRNPKGAATQIMLMHMNDRAARQLKYETIRNCIFAADIEPSAVDIAQLRLWLSLVIDDEINPNATSILDGHRNPLPLPNLECNILCGNSLIDEFEGMKLINESDIIGTAGDVMQFNIYQNAFDTLLDKLIEKQEELFRCDDTEKKYQVLQDISALRDEVIMSQLRNTASTAQLDRYQSAKEMASKPFVLWQLDFAKVFREKGGFDIVIGNPPYGAKVDPNDKKAYSRIYKCTKTIKGVQKGSSDTFALFIEKGITLLASCGFQAYIVPMSVTSSDAMTALHNILESQCTTIWAASFSNRPKQIFDSACVRTSILMLEKRGRSIEHLNTTKLIRRSETNTIESIISNLSYVDSLKYKQPGRYPKVGSKIETDILSHLFSQGMVLGDYYDQNGKPIYYRAAGGRYFNVVTPYATGSSQEVAYYVRENSQMVIGAILSSSLFWFYQQVYTDGLHIKHSELISIPIPDIGGFTASEIDKITNTYQRYLIEMFSRMIRSINMVVLFSTHSTEIINRIKPDNIYMLENLDGTVKSLNPCYPNYAIRNLYVPNGYDFLILVEDELAKAVVERLIRGNNIGTTFYPSSAHEQRGEGEPFVCYDSGEKHVLVSSKRLVTRAQTVITCDVYQAEGSAPFTDFERRRVETVQRMMLTYLNKTRQDEIMEKLLYFDDDGYHNLRYFYARIMKNKQMGTLVGKTAIRINLKNFSVVNEQGGKIAGDTALRNYIAALSEAAGPEGFVSRLGGDNFVALFNTEHLPDVLKCLEGIPIPYDDQNRIVISAVAGICSILDDSDITNPGELMNRIIQAYLIAKRENTDDIIYYTDEFKHAKAKAAKVQRRFVGALKKREFLVYYQPKVDISTRKIIGAEALCRWIHKGRLIPPIDFIPALERGSDICKLDFYMLDSVCQDLRRWLDAGQPVVRISVNLSRRHLTDPDLFEHILEIVDRHNVPHELIEIELTETTTDVEFKDLKRVVAALQASGISTSVDDFGVGYSSLNLIKQIPWDVLKLDKSILPQEGEDIERGNRMFAHVIAMAHEIGLICVAEGVETEEQLDIMRQYGCRIAQGFLFDRPMPVDDFEARLRNG